MATPPGAPDPGGTICLACGPAGSPAYLACNAAVSIGQIPACAGPGQKIGGGGVANTSGCPAFALCGPNDCACIYCGNPSMIQACQAQAAGAGGQPSVGVNPAAGSSILSSLGITNPNDVLIRAGLIILGTILLIVAIAHMLHQPDVEVIEE